MKKSNFIALILGTIGTVFFALGMCMALIEEWGMFRQGIVCGVIGLVVLLADLIIWRRMEGKGLLHCQVEGRTRHYTPAVERQSAARQETRSFLDRVYQGSVGLMVSSLVRDEALSREDLDQLYEILRQAEERIT